MTILDRIEHIKGFRYISYEGGTFYVSNHGKYGGPHWMRSYKNQLEAEKAFNK